MKEQLEADLATIEEAVKAVTAEAEKLATTTTFFEGHARAKKIYFTLRSLNPQTAPKSRKFLPTTDPGPAYQGQAESDAIVWGAGAGDELEGDGTGDALPENPEGLENMGDFNPVTDGANEYLAKQAASEATETEQQAAEAAENTQPDEQTKPKGKK